MIFNVNDKKKGLAVLKIIAERIPSTPLICCDAKCRSLQDFLRLLSSRFQILNYNRVLQQLTGGLNGKITELLSSKRFQNW